MNAQYKRLQDTRRAARRDRIQRAVSEAETPEQRAVANAAWIRCRIDIPDPMVLIKPDGTTRIPRDRRNGETVEPLGLHWSITGSYASPAEIAEIIGTRGSEAVSWQIRSITVLLAYGVIKRGGRVDDYPRRSQPGMFYSSLTLGQVREHLMSVTASCNGWDRMVSIARELCRWWKREKGSHHGCVKQLVWLCENNPHNRR